MEKVDIVKNGGRWWMVRRLTQWEIRQLTANGTCPRCEGKEDLNHDCKRKSWAILVVEEGDMDDEGVLIVFDSEKKRKEAEIENFGEKIVDLGDGEKKSAIYSEKVDDANEIQPPEFTLSLGCSVPWMKMLNSGEGGVHEERKGEGRRVCNPTQPKLNSLNQNSSLLNLQYPTQFFINPSTSPTKIYDPGPNNPLSFTHPISNHLSIRPTLIPYFKKPHSNPKSYFTKTQIQKPYTQHKNILRTRHNYAKSPSLTLLHSAMSERGSSAVITLGGKGASLTSSSVYAIPNSLVHVRLDSSALDRLSSSPPNQDPPTVTDYQVPLLKALTLEESRASLTVLLNKLLSLQSGLGVRAVLSVHISEILNSGGDKIASESVEVSEDERALLEKLSLPSVFCGVCAVLDYKSTALSTIIDAMAALLWEVSGADVAAFNSIDSGDGFTAKEEIAVAGDLKVLLNGSKLVGKVNTEEVLEILKINGKLRVVKLVHSSTRIELKSGVRVGMSGTAKALGANVMALVSAVKNVGESSLFLAKMSLSKVGGDELKSLFGKDCLSLDSLRSVYKLVLDAHLAEDYIKFVHEANVLLELVLKIVVWETVIAIAVLTNHFKVNVTNVNGHFFHYSVSLSYEDGCPVDGKGIGRRVIDRVQETYDNELAGKHFAYDGEKGLSIVGPLPRNKLEFTVMLEEISSSRNNGNGSPDGCENPSANDRKRVRRPYRSKTYKVEISFAAKIPMQSIANALRGQESENSQEALRVLDIILRQHAAKQGCLLVRQSFFHNDPKNFADVGGGVLGCRGFHSSFRTTQGGLSLNIDVSTTMIIQPGPVVDFLIANQQVRDPYAIDWAKAKRTLKNLRIKVAPSNQEYKITGLSEKPCREQMFSLKQKNVRDEDGEVQSQEITVYDYFVNHRNMDLRYSADIPCINVGKPKRPTYIPLELCSLVSLQRYTKALNTLQRASLVEKSRQKPQERMNTLSNVLRNGKYDAEPILRSCGISISTNFAKVEGRVLSAPRLKVGNGEDFFPRNGRWNFNNKKLVEPTKIERWALVNFSARCDIRGLVRDLIKCGDMKGIKIDDPFDVFEENPQLRRAPPLVRVEKMFDDIQSKLPGAPQFLLCLLPERKNCELYGPWKRKNLAEFGIVTQCIAPTRVNDQYLTNVLLKINAKLGGLNSILAVEHSPSIPVVSKAPTIILGMDVSHGSPGQSDIPSIAAVVSSRHWPLISRYRAAVRTQSPKVEMIDSLFKKISDTVDEGIMRELLLDFYTSSGKRKPDQIIIFRDGVSESQFNQVLNIELDQIIEACKFLDEKWSPKFVVIVAQKNHHTKFFQSGSPDNVPPGTVIDNRVCHPKNYDFYLCAHAGMIGTTRPTHYHVLLDEVGFSADDLQDLVHSLSYVYQRSTTAISVVAPICYAHLAASQVGSFVKFDDKSETSSSHGGMTTAGAAAVPQLPRLQEKVCNSMFFC